MTLQLCPLQGTSYNTCPVFNLKDVLLSIGGLILHSRDVFVPERPATFFCFASVTVSNVSWYFNGTLYSGNQSGISVDFELGHQARLSFDHQSLNYNGTTIQCRAESDEGCSFESNNRTLIVEGTQSADYTVQSRLRSNLQIGMHAIRRLPRLDLWVAQYYVDWVLS